MRLKSKAPSSTGCFVSTRFNFVDCIVIFIVADVAVVVVVVDGVAVGQNVSWALQGVPNPKISIVML